jgi:RNA polymerase sigma factor (sigma-70 family)
MKIGRGVAFQRQFGQLFEGQSVAGLGEVQLLERFVERRDEPAFAALVARHGPMVLGVCRKLLADPLDVEDAFQATFLVLVRRAGSLKDRDRLAPWLFGVARKVATRARADLARRRDRERSGVDAIAATYALDGETRELGRALIEEIDRLPASLREPILLCCVEGLTYDEAASQLRSTTPAIRGRLARARGRLKDRLTRRGFAPTVGSLGALLTAEAVSAAVPLRLLKFTIQVAKAGAVPADVLILAEGVLRTMILTKSKILAAAVMSCCVAGSSLGVVAQQQQSPAPPSESERLGQVEKKLDRVLKALEGKASSTPVPPPAPAAPPAPPDALNPSARSLIEGLTKGAGTGDVQVSLQVLTDEELKAATLDGLDPATRAIVEKAIKGQSLKDLMNWNGKVIVMKDGKPTTFDGLDPANRASVEKLLGLPKEARNPTVVPGGITITKAAPAEPRLEALERKIRELEAKVGELERRLDAGPESPVEAPTGLSIGDVHSYTPPKNPIVGRPK